TGVVVGPASVYEAVSQLRKLLGDENPIPTYIVTVRRKGYRLIATVQRAATSSHTPQAPVAHTAVLPLRAAVAACAVAALGLAAAYFLGDKIGLPKHTAITSETPTSTVVVSDK